MLNFKDSEELLKIVEKSNEFLAEHDIEDFSITGLNWDDDESQWIVSYCSDYSNHEFINVWVMEVGKSDYRLAGHSFEKPGFHV